MLALKNIKRYDEILTIYNHFLKQRDEQGQKDSSTVHIEGNFWILMQKKWDEVKSLD